MRTEEDPRTRPARPLPDLDAEQEIDFGRYGRAVLQRWWLVLAAVVVGALIGWLVSAAENADVNRAEATVYLGQPTTAGGSAQVSTFATNPTAVRELARSDEVVDDVAAQVGIEPGELRSGISTSAVGGAATTRPGQQPTPLYEIAVSGTWPRATVAEAANLLAAAVIDGSSVYVDTKIETYERGLATIGDQIDSIDQRIAQLQEAAQDPGLESVERLIFLNLIATAEDRRSELVQEQAETELLLTQAQQVEKGRLISEARGSAVAARSNRTSIVVGGLIGLIAGIVLALAWEPLQRRRRRLRVSGS
jgi:capsular polysaccharide biosynthesis protein